MESERTSDLIRNSNSPPASQGDKYTVPAIPMIVVFRIALLLCLSIGLLAAKYVHADDTYRVTHSDYFQLLASKGAPLLKGAALELTPIPQFFPWIQPGEEESEGLNFEINGRPLQTNSNCSDADGHLAGFSGIVSPPLFDSEDESAPRKFAYAMAHESWAFAPDEETIQKLPLPDSTYARAFNERGRIFSLSVGKKDSATLKFFRSESGSILGLCIKDARERRGERCFGLANTKVAGYELTVDPLVYDHANRLECVLEVLGWLEAQAKMHEAKQ